MPVRDVYEPASVRNVIAHRGTAVTSLDLRRDYPVTTNNVVSPLVDGEVSDKLLADIKKAKASLHILNLEYIAGDLTDRITDMLIDKHKEGVKVRVMTDFMGGRQMYPSNRVNIDKMRAAGIEVFVNWTVPNGLEHRKVFVIDGRAAYTGGWCLRDESATGEFHDFMVRVKGDAVAQLQSEFCLGWRWHGGKLDGEMPERQFKARYFPQPKLRNPGCKTRIVQSVPGIVNGVHAAMMEVMGRATKTLDIEVAYALREDFFETCQQKAKDGVRVRLIVPGEPDNESYDRVLKSWYQPLMDAGVEIYHWKGYNHGKVVIADERHVWMGSSNPEVVFSAPRWGTSRAFDAAVVIDDKETAKRIYEKIAEPDFTSGRATRVTEVPVDGWYGWAKTKAANYIYSWF